MTDWLPSVWTLPHLNAALNAAAAVALGAGYAFIRRGRVRAHRACMVAAVGISAVFLAAYVAYHVQVGSVRFEGAGWLRPVYFGILISHAVLAVSVLPLAAVTLVRAVAGEFERHRTIALWTLPVWLYVSVTGVLVYVFVYRLG